jgi:CPA2 family monovalent cation:H+ antiporter-2
VHGATWLTDLVVLLAASLPIVFVCQRVGMPALVGFLLTGIAIGPTAAGLIASTEDVNFLAELGVVLLLFTIGLEFSLERLSRLARDLVVGGTLQVALTLAVVVLMALLAGYGASEAVVIGFAVSLSSTAVVLTLLAGRGELYAPHGQLTLAILLFQDLCVLPMMLVLPILGRDTGVALFDVLARMAGALVVVAVVLFTARTALGVLLTQVLRLRSRELFIGTVVLACFGTAWLTAQLGLSLAIGAFLAGLVVSESEYGHQAVAEVLPMRHLFSSIFFVSIGMLLDFDYILSHVAEIAALVAGVIVLKGALGALAIVPLRASPRLGLLVGAGLAQIGEFSFVIAGQARHVGALETGTFQLVVAVSVFTMLLSPAVGWLAALLPGVGDIPDVGPGRGSIPEPPARGHVVVVGYGLNGRNLTRVLREAGIAYSVVDLGAQNVADAREAGEPVVFGDATREVVLRHVHADSAAVIVLTIADPAATRRIVALVRGMNPHASLVVRTRYVAEIEELTDLGADEIIPDEFETSVELFARVLEQLHIPRNVVSAQVDVVRAEHYAMLRGQGTSRRYIESLYELFTAATTATYLLRESSPAVGRTIGELDLAGRTGVGIINVVRKGRAITNPSPEFELRKGDIFVLLGNHSELQAARTMLDPPVKREQEQDQEQAPQS